MAASINDLFAESTTNDRPNAATTTAIKSNGATSITVDSTTGWPTDTAVHFTMYEVDANNAKIASTQRDYKGIVNSSTTINNVVVRGGADREFPIGAKVICAPTAAWADDLVSGLTADHSQAGAHEFTTVYDPSNPTLETLKLAGVSSAVNEVTITNAATGNAPEISATGGDSNIDVDIIPKGTGEVTKNGYPIDWWEEIGRTTLSSAGDTITVSSIPVRKYLRIIVYTVATGGTTDLRLRFNNDSGSNYAHRESSNGGADTTAVSQTSILVSGTAARTYLYTVDVLNVATQEKYTSGFRVDTTAGAGNAPNKTEQTAKWANTTDQITRVDILNTGGTGDYAIGSEVVVLGHD